MTIAVIIPTYGRAERMERVACNIRASSETPVVVFFAIESDDAETVAEAWRLHEEGLALSLVNIRKRHNSAGAVNTVVAVLRALLDHDFDWFFLGADDLDFTPGWDTAALRAAGDGVLVIGTNDLHNPYVLDGTHATHYLVHRAYIPRCSAYDPDMTGQVLFEGYDHNFTDAEFIDAAKAAGVFAPCLASVVEHRHPAFGLSAQDDTYEKGWSRVHEDHELFRSREHLWTDHPDGRRLL